LGSGLGGNHPDLARQRATGRIDKNRQARNGRKRFLEELETLALQVLRLEVQPGDVASGPRDAGDEPVADRLFHGRYDDRNSLGCVLSGQSCCGIRCDDDIDVETHGLGRKLREALRCAASPAPFDHDVSTIDVAEVAELLDEGIDGWGSRRRTRREQGDPRHLLHLLRQRGPRCGRDQTGDEIATPHLHPLPYAAA